MGIFTIFLELTHQNKYSDQVSCSYLHFYGNYEILLFEPILVHNDVILAQNDVIAPQAEIREVPKLLCKLGLWVYTCM